MCPKFIEITKHVTVDNKSLLNFINNVVFCCCPFDGIYLKKQSRTNTRTCRTNQHLNRN